MNSNENFPLIVAKNGRQTDVEKHLSLVKIFPANVGPFEYRRSYYQTWFAIRSIGKIQGTIRSTQDTQSFLHASVFYDVVAADKFSESLDADYSIVALSLDTELDNCRLLFKHRGPLELGDVVKRAIGLSNAAFNHQGSYQGWEVLASQKPRIRDSKRKSHSEMVKLAGVEISN